MFGDAELNRFETEAASGNQDLQAAAARFAQARANTDVARSGLFPHLTGAATGARQRDSENRPVGGKPGQTYDSFSVPFDLSYELDLWGRVRRRVESARAAAEAAAADLESARLAVHAEIAADYFTLRALDAERELLVPTIAAYRQSLELTRHRREAGLVSDLDAARAEAQLSAAEAQRPTLDVQRAQFEHALAALVGQTASSFHVEVRPAAAITPRIPPGLPSDLLERRPDIAAAERRMAAANAAVGVATAAFFPTIRLAGQARADGRAEPLPRRARHLPPGGHGADRGAGPRARPGADARPAPGHRRRSRQGPRRRLGRRPRHPARDRTGRHPLSPYQKVVRQTKRPVNPEQARLSMLTSVDIRR